jgi:hypothetical protein
VKIGLENKKELAALVALVLIAGYFLYTNVLAPTGAAPAAGSAAVSTAAQGRAASPSPAAALSPRAGARPLRREQHNRNEEFHPVLHSKNPEDQIDPNPVDPRIRLDLLAKLQNVPPAGGGRNLFQTGPPPPKPSGPEPNIPVPKPLPGPRDVFPHDDEAKGPPPPPPLPPITFKYYGLTTVRRNGKRTAFFMNGEEILIRGVGDMVAGSYRLVSIGLTSATVEDTQSKRQQTVPLAEETQG